MPKPIFGINGSGMHTNMSLFRGGKNAFYDPNGIERGLTPPPEITENIFAMDEAARQAHGIDSLPGSLKEAIHALEADPLILDTLGIHVAANDIQGKKKEWEEYRTHVSSWEREKYIINY